MGACLGTTRWEPKGAAISCLSELLLKSSGSNLGEPFLKSSALDFATWLVKPNGEEEENQGMEEEFMGLVHFLSFGDDEERSSAAESAFFRFSLVGSATLTVPLTRPSPLTGDCVCP